MRYGILFLFAALNGCAHMSHKDPESGLEVSYTGPARGAVDLVHATDPRPYDLVEEAGGMATSLVREADGDVRFSSGYGYTYSTGAISVGGYAPPNTGFIPGQGFVTGPPQSGLPPLATMVAGVPQTGQGIVPCPMDRHPATVPEQAACAASGVESLTRNRTK